MKPRTLVLALAAMGTTAPVLAQTGPDVIKPEDNCAMMFVYAVNQVCSLLSNGLTQCQPVGMVGPSPNCPSAGLQPLMPVPLSAPVVKAAPPMAAPYGAYGRPYGMPYGVPYGLPNPYGGPYGVPWAGFAPQPGMMALPGWPPQTPAGVAQPPQAKPPVQASAVPAAAPEASAAPVVAKPEAAPVARAETPAKPEPVPEAPTQSVAAAPALTTTPAPAVALVETPIAATAPTVPAAPAAAPSPVPPAASADAAAEAARQAREMEDALAHFEFDSAALTPLGRSELDAWLAQAAKDKPIRLSGHADRLGPTHYNLELSRRRAETVRQYLLDKGLDGKLIQVEAKGESEPVKACKGGANPVTKECLAPNRRVEIEIIGKAK